MSKYIDARDALFVLGLAALCTGVGSYDWRLAAICGGCVLLLLAVWPALRKGE